MYSNLKRFVKALVPKGILFKYEPFFRWFYGIFFIGTHHQCPVCEHKLRAFIQSRHNLMCPFCGSLPRNRRLWLLLKKRGDLSGHVLHFSPSRSLYRQLKREMGIRYFSSDFEGEFLADHAFDITVIDQPPDKFDLIICYHVLEHIPDDKLAMSELYRVLKPGGRIYIQTPFHNGEIYEDPTITSPAARELHFGQADHVRIYSVTGLEQRLANAGFKVEVLQFGHDETDAYFGLSSGETLLIARK